jgi:hypothetical protein
MSRKNRRGPQPLKGRGAPIGPVFGLARAEQIERVPLKYTSETETARDGSTEVKWSRVAIERVKIDAELLVMSAGKIGLKGIHNANISLTAGQRRPLQYSADGNARFDAARQVMDAEQWKGMQEGGKLLVVSGCLVRMTAAVGAPAQFDFRPLMWDVADPEQHVQGKLALPAEAEVGVV